ncbi:MAG: superoxide dismutase [Cu-Zn] SodC [Francisellaceae bacterium]
MKKLSVFILVMLLFQLSAAAEIKTYVFLVDAKKIEKNIGYIVFKDVKDGLLITPDLRGLSPGFHGFHIHENPSCLPGLKDGKAIAALKAGGHFDPNHTGKHLGPNGMGHLGDLPALYVNSSGDADTPVLAPHLTTKLIQNRSVMIHAGGDNYQDQPLALGGGGARVACGVIK